MKVVVDTSSWGAYFRGDERPLISVALTASSIVIPALVYTELLGHPVVGKERERWEKFLKMLALGPSDRAHFERAGKLKREMEGRGLAVSSRDVHIAQTALDAGAILVTEAPHFLEMRKYCSLQVQVG